MTNKPGRPRGKTYECRIQLQVTEAMMEALNGASLSLSQPRNALIRQAINDWLHCKDSLTSPPCEIDAQSSS